MPKLFISILLCLFCVRLGASQDLIAEIEDDAAEVSKAAEPVVANDDETAVRAFLAAMVRKDKAALKVLSVANSDLDVLVQGLAPPAAAIPQIVKFMNALPIRQLKVGEEFRLPGNKTIVMDEGLVNQDRHQLVVDRQPVPFDVVRVDGKWKVNPTAIIAARKAAARMRAKTVAAKGDGQEAVVHPPGSPEAVLQSWLVAVAQRDLDALKKVSLPHDDLGILTEGRGGVADGQIAGLKSRSIKRLKVGDEFRLPSGRLVKIDPQRVSDKRQQLVLKNYPVPFEVVQVAGGWKVNPVPMIQTRKLIKKRQKQNQGKPRVF